MRAWAFLISIVVGGLGGAMYWLVKELVLPDGFYFWTIVGAIVGVLICAVLVRRSY